MKEIHYYIIDLETTGFSSKFNEVHEIGIIREKDKVQLVKNIKCKFPGRANYDSLKLSGKTIDDLKKGEDLRSVINECNKLFNEDQSSPDYRCIVGHNIWSFDRKFLVNMWKECGFEFPANLWLDTMLMMKFLYKKNNLKKKAGLEDSCNHFGIKKSASAHNAKNDTRQNYFLLQKLRTEIDIFPFIKRSSKEDCEDDNLSQTSIINNITDDIDIPYDSEND